MRPWSLGLLVVLVIGVAGIWFMSDSTAPETAEFTTDSKPTDRPTDLAEVRVPDSPEEIAAQQIEANAAAGSQLGVGQLSGPIQERPEFVSRIEWRVLNQVAEASPDKERELTRLVNHLRFSKQLEIWKNQANGPEAERDALARQLLRDIPVRVYSRDLSPGRAQQLQAELVGSLYDDPQERRRRIAEEAERIGVSFDVDKTRQDGSNG
tara:strand:- start:5076 stop:5702 length:627 start_codon:yes stop_codon:yes gene_type:complete